jgi:signal transduction histidine kinase
MVEAAAAVGLAPGDDLAAEMLALQPGAHLCLIYDNDPSEQMPALLPYFQQGLDNGERCIYVADDQTNEQLAMAFTEYGIDAVPLLASGALQFLRRDEWRQPGELDSARKSEQVRAIIDEALAEYAGVRIAVEMTWTLGPDIDSDLLEHWEATINDIFTPAVPARIVCQYSRARLTRDALEAGIATHPLVVLGTDVCPNPFYKAPFILGSHAPDNTNGARLGDEDRVDWMIAQLRWARAYESERSRRVQAEENARRAELNRRRTQEMYDMAWATAEDLRKAHQIKDEFLGMVSHELRTPLTTIYGNARILNRASLMLADDDRKQAMQDIESEAERLQQIIENLLVLARFERDGLAPGSGFEVRERVEEILSDFRRRRPTRSITLRFVKSGIDDTWYGRKPADLHIAASEVYLEIVLKNLLSNADKYSPPGAPIDVLVETVREKVWFTILDRGKGLPPDDLSRIFEPFDRGSYTGHTEGLGIGLAVCKRIVSALGGAIQATPRRDGGGGSEFSFGLPLAD